MTDLIDRQIAIAKVKELFAMGDCYCDKPSIIGMLNSIEPAKETELIQQVYRIVMDYATAVSRPRNDCCK